jgi:DNA-binding response OmpR family regulator
MAKKILVVDDDVAIVESLRYLLEDAGYQVQTAEDGSFIKTILKNTKPDLILLDYWLPQQTGGDITKELKSKKETKVIPVIIISASYNIRELVSDAGADDFLEKPYDIQQMLNMVTKHIPKRE